MNKYLTGERIKALNIQGLSALAATHLSREEFLNLDLQGLKALFESLNPGKSILIKPADGGSSIGVAKLETPQEALHYQHYLSQGAEAIPQGVLSFGKVELDQASQDYLIEPFIQVDKIYFDGNDLHYEDITGILEFTVGFYQNPQVCVLTPSLTVALGDILTLEEKFQGGTGVNLTPPPEDILSSLDRQFIQNTLSHLIRELGLFNYARIDLFFDKRSRTVFIIEINTLPALTPSTVLYHQALQETPSITPRLLLETIIAHAQTRYE